MRGSENPDITRQRFDEYLRRTGKRRTAERSAILMAVLGLDGHFSAESLGEQLRQKDFPVSGATVYSTLELLVDFGVLIKQRFSNKACLYEKASTAPGINHHHLICTECGKIKEQRDPAIARQINERHFAGFSQSYYTLNIYGVCNACARKKSKSHKKKRLTKI